MAHVELSILKCLHRLSIHRLGNRAAAVTLALTDFRRVIYTHGRKIVSLFPAKMRLVHRTVPVPLSVYVLEVNGLRRER